MNRRHTLVLLLCLLLIIVAGCEQSSIADQERIKSLETLQASTPSATATPTQTPTLTPTLSPTSTTGPSPTPTSTPTPTNTAIPSLTPLPPTPTPNPALANFSLCNQVAGALDGGRFSARIGGTITPTLDPAFERITIELNVPSDSAPPHAIGRCLNAADDPAGAPAGLAGPYLLLVDLPGWLHDDHFRGSAITRTVALSGTTVLKSVAYRFDPNAAAGATLAIGLEQPLPYRLALESNPYRLVLDVAKPGTTGQISDMLTSESGGAARPDAPIFYLQDGDIWKFADGQAANLTSSPEIETALAVARDGSQVAFCRAAAGADIGDALAPSELWSMSPDGTNQSSLAAPGRSCADPVFSPDGQQIAFSVDEAGTSPIRQSIWAFGSGGTVARLTAMGDEWSRFGPQWLDNSHLVYAATAEDGRSTLFLLNMADGTEQDIGAELTRGNRYRTLGRPLAAPDGSAIAVEGLRAEADGADMILIDASGATLNTVGGVFWARPLAWAADGTLYYLKTNCASEVAQDYALHARAPDGDDKPIANGMTLGNIGDFSTTGNGVAYVVLAHAPPGPRGPLAIDRQSPGALWFWELASGARAKLAEARAAIDNLAP